MILPILFAVVLGFAATAPTAIERFHDLIAHLKQDRKDNNWNSSLEHAKALKELLNGSPRSLLELARAELQLGHESQAWAEVDRFLAMGQASDILTSSTFAGLHASGSHPDLVSAMKKNQTAISLGTTAFVLSDAGLVAEDIDYDAATRKFYVSSIREKKIIVVDDKGNAKDFAESPDHWPVLALKVDDKRALLWATEVALNDFSIAPKADWGRSAVLAYDLATGKLRSRVPGPTPSALGDMTLAENGDPLVSDGEGGGIYRVHDGRLERIDAGDFISPQTSAIFGDGKRIFVPDYIRGIGILDLTTRQVTWLSGEDEHALDGIDGLYFSKGLLLATQNGASPERVAAFALDAPTNRISTERVIERATETLGDPTHGVVVGNDFYYIANSGWDKLDDHGDVLPGKTPTPARIMRVPLSGIAPR